MSDETGFSIISTIVQQLRNVAEAFDEQAARFTWKKLASQTISRTWQFPNPYIQVDENCAFRSYERYRSSGQRDYNINFFRGLKKRSFRLLV